MINQQKFIQDTNMQNIYSSAVTLKGIADVGIQINASCDTYASKSRVMPYVRAA